MKDADKHKVLSFHETLSSSRYTTVLEKRNSKIIKIIPAKDGTVEGEDKAPAKAKVEVNFFLRKQEGNYGNLHSDITADIVYIKKGRTWKVSYVIFK